MSGKAEYWIDLADYDFETAKAMQKTSRYLYVGFMCHQTIEKALKAIIAECCAEGDIPPKTHDLSKLAKIAKVFEDMTESQLEFIEFLNPINVGARYPECSQHFLSVEECAEIVKETEELLCWIKKQLRE